MDAAAAERVATTIERLFTERDGKWIMMLAVPCDQQGDEQLALYSDGVAIRVFDDAPLFGDGDKFPFEVLDLPAPDSPSLLKTIIGGRPHALYELTDVVVHLAKSMTLLPALSRDELVTDLVNNVTGPSKLPVLRLQLRLISDAIPRAADTISSPMLLGDCLSEAALEGLASVIDQPSDPPASSWLDKPSLL